MKKETVENRIKSFEFWKWFNLIVGFVLGIIAGTFGVHGDYSRMSDFHTNIVLNMMSLFFTIFFWVCYWFEQMYRDMLEEKE